MEKALFDPTYLDALLAHPDYFDEEIEIPCPQGTLSFIENGIWRYIPHKDAPQKKKFILSSGIHGNETAPIEIVNELLQDILEERLAPVFPTLLIFGNPKAMTQHKRFVDFNLNRLFSGTHENHDDNVYEKHIAKKLERETLNFVGHSDDEVIHFDLHTAIRQSKHYRFAVQPVGKDYSQETYDILQSMGIEAVLHSHKKGTTFSCFSASYLNAYGFTLELGRVKPFGENDPNDFKDAKSTLKALLLNKKIETNSHSKPIHYQVKAELIRKQEKYEFFIEDDTANFTTYPKETKLDENYTTSENNEAIVFPNPHVALGQRSCLVVVKRS